MRAIAAHAPDPATVLARTKELLVTMDAARFASCIMLYVMSIRGRESHRCQRRSRATGVCAR
ncbi:hypothetical protein ABZY02_33280 [Streptomyces sp. NPDC006649]|uniref:hypothetical protein n=1 Tax=Streptomyces sp. NPDC006649 TaxID=3156896 RepID=UPI0033AC7F82